MFSFIGYPTNQTVDLAVHPVLEQMNSKLVQLVSNIIMVKPTKKVSIKKNFVAYLNPIFQHIILTSSK